MIFALIILSTVGLLAIFLLIVYIDEPTNFGFACWIISILSFIGLYIIGCILYEECKEIKSTDVHDITTLQITYHNGVPTDTVLIK